MWVLYYDPRPIYKPNILINHLANTFPRCQIIMEYNMPSISLGLVHLNVSHKPPPTYPFPTPHIFLGIPNFNIKKRLLRRLYSNF